MSKDDELQSISGDHAHKYFHQMLNMADDELDVHEYRLLGHYIRVAGGKKSFREGIRKTATKTKMGVDTVREARSRLRSKGYINFEDPAMEETGAGIATSIEIVDRWEENIGKYSKKAPIPSQVRVSQETPIPSQVRVPIPNQVHLLEDVSTEDKEIPHSVSNRVSPSWDTSVQTFTSDDADEDPAIAVRLNKLFKSKLTDAQVKSLKQRPTATVNGEAKAMPSPARLYDEDILFRQFVNDVIAYERIEFKKYGKSPSRSAIVKHICNYDRRGTGGNAGWIGYEKEKRKMSLDGGNVPVFEAGDV